MEDHDVVFYHQHCLHYFVPLDPDPNNPFDVDSLR